MKFDEPSWIPAPLQRCWREGCKPDRILNHIRRFHEEMPTRVSEEHVKAAWVQQVYSPATLQTHLSGIKLICWVI